MKIIRFLSVLCFIAALICYVIVSKKLIAEDEAEYIDIILFIKYIVVTVWLFMSAAGIIKTGNTDKRGGAL